MKDKKKGLAEKKKVPDGNSRPIQRYILTKIPRAKKGQSVKEILGVLEKESNTYDTVDNVYVVDDDDQLLGVASIRELFNNPLKTPIEKIMKSNIVSASPETDAEKVADLALKHDLKAIPIVENKKLIGAITSRKVISIVNKALKEDIFHFAGVHRSHLEFDNSLEVPLGRAVKSRLPWLLIGLVGAMVMALFIHSFEETLTKYIIIAAFIPAIVYMSGALSAQILTILIRDLAVLGKSMKLRLYIFRQMLFTFFVSIIVVAIMFVLISLVWGEYYISLVISLATFISLLATSLISIFIAILIKRFKFDPALGSGPIATVISDMSSVVIYFIVVVIMI